VLYEMATGKRAFRRGSAPETMTAIIREEAEPLPEPSTDRVLFLVRATSRTGSIFPTGRKTGAS